ncbi:MAG: hypothetical protein Q9191_002286 [Dirinaria sp. TL-2023a]
MRFNAIFTVVLTKQWEDHARSRKDKDDCRIGSTEKGTQTYQRSSQMKRTQKEMGLTLPGYTHNHRGNGGGCYHPTEEIRYPVNWPVGDDTDWVDTEADFQGKTGIYRYRLYEDLSEGDFQYMLEFSTVDRTVEWSRTYTFIDAAGNLHPVEIVMDDDAAVGYDSNAPTIE